MAFGGRFLGKGRDAFSGHEIRLTARLFEGRYSGERRRKPSHLPYKSAEDRI